MTDPEQIIVPGGAGPVIDQPLQFAVTVRDAQAVLHFSEPREYIALDANLALAIGTKIMLAAVEANPDQGRSAIEMAMHLIDLVYEVNGQLKPAGGAVKHELIERHRSTLTQRLSVVMNSTREKRTVSNRSLARQLVDIMLNEVFA